jgi:hypothetical protein
MRHVFAEKEPRKMPEPDLPGREAEPTPPGQPEIYPAPSPTIEPQRHDNPEIVPSREPEISPVPSPGIPMPGTPEIAPYG